MSRRVRAEGVAVTGAVRNSFNGFADGTGRPPEPQSTAAFRPAGLPVTNSHSIGITSSNPATSRGNFLVIIRPGNCLFDPVLAGVAGAAHQLCDECCQSECRIRHLKYPLRACRKEHISRYRHSERSFMPQAIANPEELRAFAQKLKQFNNTLSDQAAMLANQLETLSASWRDQENLKFTEEFKEHMRLLAQFVEANNRHIPYLMRKAERLEEYLQQR
jgi:uncharacterized protein YukE